MIIREQGDQLLLIRQTDHAFLAGFLAKEWGNDEFPRPEPFESFCLAVGEHDNGWAEWELQPTLDEKSRLPYSFMSVPTDEHIALYQRGIERLVKVDHYAALLVSMHCVGLYDRARATMPGFSAKYVKSTETALVSEFVQRLRLQQLRLKVDLRANPATKDLVVEDAVKGNFERLEALDRLSLHLCLNPIENCTIDAVPADGGGREVDLDLRSEGGNVLTLGPYPFKREVLELSILARRIPKRVYVDEVDFQKTLAEAQYFPIQFTLRARRANAIYSVAKL